MTSIQTNPGDPESRSGALDALWRPAGIAYLAAMLVGLAVGLWPVSIRGSVNPYWPASVPAVQTLAVAQALFYLLVYPVIVLFRSRTSRGWRAWPDAIVEMLFWTAISAVFYVPAVWLSGSRPYDAIRAAAYICCLWPVVLACGALLASNSRAGVGAMFISVLAALGLPWLWYVSAEFFPQLAWSDVLWRFCPAAGAWEIAAPDGRWGPLWAMIVWPVTGGVIFAIGLMAGSVTGERDHRDDSAA